MAKTIAVLLIACGLGSSLAANVTPIQKVVQMMDAMLAKGKAMKHEEEVEFANSKEWCENVRTQTSRAIAESSDEIEQLSADISKASSDAETLAEEIQDLEKDTDSSEAEAKTAGAERSREHKAYAAEHVDLVDAIAQLEKAKNVMKAKSKDAPASLMQVSMSKLVDPKSKEALEAFLSLHDKTGAPYEKESNGVMDMLENLKAKFEDEKLALEKEEMNAKFAHDKLMQQLTDDIKAGKKAASTKTAAKAGRLEDAAQAKGDLTSAQSAKATDEKTLADTIAECDAKSQEFERNQVTRSDEIKAISKAIEIMSNDNVQGTGEKRLPGALLQIKKASAFAYLRSSEHDVPELRRKTVAYLQARASMLGSRYLSVAAAHAAADPFAKIKQEVKGMIEKLTEEANSEADEHGYCEAEMATNKQTREIKSSEVDELSSKIDMEAAKSAKLSAQITDLADALSALKAKQSEATSMRSAEKKTNAKVVAEAKEAQGAVESAIKVLKDFYSSSASLMQDSSIATMSDAGKAPYKGMQAGSGGVLGMLDVVLSDFARLETETSEAESLAQRAYDTFMNESNQDAAVKETEKKHKENNRDRADEKLHGLKKELEMTQSELDSAMDYYDKIKAKCLDTGMSYEERKRMREEEIESLQQSLKALDGQEPA